MTDDTWVKERANKLAAMSGHGVECQCVHCRQGRDAILAVLLEAVKLGRALQAEDQGQLAKQMAREGRKLGLEDVIARLANPDEAMIEAVIEAVRQFMNETTYRCEGDEVRLCRALAAVLSASPEEG